MVSQTVEIRIVFGPIGELRSASADRSFQHFEGCLDVAQLGIAAGNVVERKWIIGIDGQGAINPFARPLHVAQFEQCPCTQVRRSGVVWV